MSWKIVLDSSADLNDSFIPAEDVTVDEVPFIIHVQDDEYTDDKNLDTNVLMDAISAEKEASTTSCPSPGMYEKAFEDGDKIIAVTISHKLSGSYNAAELAKRTIQEKFPEKEIHIVDSLSTGGQEYLIAEKANELIAEGKDFDEIVKELEKYRDSLKTLFTLNSFDNLIKNGRLSKFKGLLAKSLKIRIVGEGHYGELKILHKVRGEAKAISTLVEEMKKMKDMKGQNVIILEADNMAGATAMKHLIQKKYPDVGNIRIFRCGGLNSYYAERGGLIVGF